MQPTRSLSVALALCAALSGVCTYAAEPVGADGAKAQYDAERARCSSGTTGQDQQSCLRSAGAAYALVRDNKLRDPNVAYRENALARCAALSEADRVDCESRVDGGGERSGSVKGGGIVTETVTTTVGPK